jgi:nickel-dependent lactate racemase
LPQLADLTICSPGGYPRDINLHQAQKALSVAERTTRPGGVIVLVAECRDGAGSSFTRWLEEVTEPGEMIERFKTTGWSDSSGKAMMFARAALSHHVFLVSPAFDQETVGRWFLRHATSVGEAVEHAGSLLGPKFSTCILPKAGGLIPASEKHVRVREESVLE